MKWFSFLVLLLPFLVGCRGRRDDWQTDLAGVLATSSPRVADLNADGTDDVVIGGGGDEWAHSDSAILALDGHDGHVLWHRPGRNQLFGSATFLDINQDKTPDIIIGGRSAELQAVDGKTGRLLWEFYKTNEPMGHKRAGWFNFTNAQLVPDQDNDRLPDLLIANGGDATINNHTSPRPVGRLLILSSRNGAILHDARVPDGKETYCSPVLVKRGADPMAWGLLFGTGGEAIGGSFYKATLRDLINNDLSGARALVTEADKGMVAPPLVCDINRDGTPDYLVSTVAARTMAIDGKTDQVLWTFSRPDAETYSQPAVGYFTGNDSIPDFFVSYAIGTYPAYERGVEFVLDGATGQAVDEYKTMGFTYASPLTVDVNEDGFDDVLMNVNEETYPDGPKPEVASWLIAFDLKNKSQFQVGTSLPGANFAITPYLGDLDHDGDVDVVFGSLGATTGRYPGLTTNDIPARVTHLARRELRGLSAKRIRWGGYMGRYGNSVYPETR